VKNWREYEKALRDRGDITLWISQDAIDAWTPPQTGKRGAQPVYSDAAIETALTFRLLFHLALRQTEGFLGSVLRLMGVELPCPDHTTLSRRNARVVVRRKIERAPKGPMCVIVDSTGLKICGQGEWHAQKHGEKKVKPVPFGQPVCLSQWGLVPVVSHSPLVGCGWPRHRSPHTSDATSATAPSPPDSGDSARGASRALVVALSVGHWSDDLDRLFDHMLHLGQGRLNHRFELGEALAFTFIVL
jgi:Transposase DDE domain